MKWLGIALVIYIFINGFIEEAKKRLSSYSDDYYEEDDYNDNDDWNNNYKIHEDDLMRVTIVHSLTMALFLVLNHLSIIIRIQTSTEC